ncbi:hypothetical protein DER45DRAFT_532520 [Fusarium avenaceum]|nr:hypothetical protein DER45DRAFT_532520 [Fusarium avenaceum]
MKKTNRLSLSCLAWLGRSTQLQLTATDARLYEIDHHWTRRIHSTRDDAYNVHNITPDPLSRIDSIHCNRSNQERGRVTGSRNKKPLQTACEYQDEKHNKNIENTYLFLTKTWKSETSDSRDSLVASASVASDATKLTGGDEDENEAPATLVAIPVCVSAPPEIEIEILDTEYLHSLC